jgi:hypothetical protein
MGPAYFVRFQSLDAQCFMVPYVRPAPQCRAIGRCSEWQQIDFRVRPCHAVYRNMGEPLHALSRLAETTVRRGFSPAE